MLYDFVGNSLEIGDLVTIKPELICGQIVKLEEGVLARGVSLSGQPKGEVQQPHIVIEIRMTSISAAMPNGVITGVLKVHNPEKKENKGLVE